MCAEVGQFNCAPSPKVAAFSHERVSGRRKPTVSMIPTTLAAAKVARRKNFFLGGWRIKCPINTF
jgi:hypothetical protein